MLWPHMLPFLVYQNCMKLLNIAAYFFERAIMRSNKFIIKNTIIYFTDFVQRLIYKANSTNHKMLLTF